MKVKFCVATAGFVIAVVGVLVAVLSYKKRCARKCCCEEEVCRECDCCYCEGEE